MRNDEKISIIIPLAENEELSEKLIEALAWVGNENEIIVSSPSWKDKENLGGIKCPVRYIKNNSGRASCLNAGAEAASYGSLFFIHGDSYFLKEGFEALTMIAQKKEATFRYFDLVFFDGPWMMKLNQWGVAFRCKFLKTPFGDQGFFINKTLFYELGGYPTDVTYGEDHILVRRANQNGVPVLPIRHPLYTSARKYIKNGWLKTTVMHLYLWRLQIKEDCSRKEYSAI